MTFFDLSRLNFDPYEVIQDFVNIRCEGGFQEILRRFSFRRIPKGPLRSFIKVSAVSLQDFAVLAQQPPSLLEGVASPLVMCTLAHQIRFQKYDT